MPKSLDHERLGHPGERTGRSRRQPAVTENVPGLSLRTRSGFCIPGTGCQNVANRLSDKTRRPWNSVEPSSQTQWGLLFCDLRAASDHLAIQLDVVLPGFRDIIFEVNRFDRTLRDARLAIDAVIRGDVTLTIPVALDSGDRFAVYEGGKTVGLGAATKV